MADQLLTSAVKLPSRTLSFATSDTNYMRWNQVILNINHNFLGWPCYTDEFLDGQFKPSDKSDTQLGRELASLKLYTGKVSTFRLVWLVTSSYIAIKDMWAVLISVLNVSHFSVSEEPTGGNYSSKEIVYNFACVQTNCTRIGSSTKLVIDLASLPMFTICRPQLVPFFTPYPDLKAQGLMLLSMWGYLFAMMVLLSIYLYLRPTPIGLFTFLFAPQSCRRDLAEKCKPFVVDVKISEINFARQAFRNNFKQMKRISQIYQPYIYKQLAMNAVRTYGPSEVKYQDNQVYLDDGIPLIRSDWWHHLLAKQFFWLVVILMLIFYHLGMIGVIYSTYVMRRLDAYLPCVDRIMQKQNCSIWIPRQIGHNTVQRQQVTLRGLTPTWNLCTLIEIIVACTPVFLILSINMVQLFISLKEICSWIDELMDLVRVAIAIGEFRLMKTETQLSCTPQKKPMKVIAATSSTPFQLSHQFTTRTTKPNALAALKRLQMNNLKSLFSLKCFECVMNSSRKRKHYLCTIYIENLLMKELEQAPDNGLRAQVDLMERVYISIRLLIDFVRESSTNLSILIVFLHVVNYGCIFQLVYLNKRFNDSQLFPLIFALTIILLLDYVITLASNIQAQSRRLMDLIWRLIAVNTSFNDVQTSHAKHLMTKLVIMLSQNDGIMFHVFGVPITYASLMRLTLWSSSLIMLVFHGNFLVL